jgi:hypothetical protein
VSLDTRLRELERQAALGDEDAGTAFAHTLQQAYGFVPCLDCGRFFPSYMEHTCDRETCEVTVDVPEEGASIKREVLFDTEVFEGGSQTSFFTNYSSFCSARAGRVKFWGVDTNLQGQAGIPRFAKFHVHRIAALLPAGCDEERRNWLLNNTYIQIRLASSEEATIPGMLCYRDESEDSEDWVIQIAGGPQEDVPFEERRGSEGIKGVDLSVSGKPVLALSGLEAFRVMLGCPGRPPASFKPLLIRVALAGFMVRSPSS